MENAAHRLQLFVQIWQMALIIMIRNMDDNEVSQNHKQKEGLDYFKDGPSKVLSVAEAGRLGGRSTMAKYGKEHFVKLGRKGGRKTAEMYREMFKKFGCHGGRPRRPSLCGGPGGE